MAMVLADRVQETTTTTGTGTISLGGAATQCQSFVSGVGNGNSCYYTILGGNGTDWEVGIGTVTSGSPNTLSRTTILASSNSGSAISLTGTSTVFCDAPAASVKHIELSSFTLSGTSIITRDNAGVYPSTTSFSVAAGDAYKLRLKVGGLNSTHSLGLWVLNGNTSAAAGYYFALQEDGNVVLYNYNNGTYTSERAAGTSTLASLPSNGIIEATIVFGVSSADFVHYQAAGLPVGLSTNFSAGTAYICGMSQTFSSIGQPIVEKLL